VTVPVDALPSTTAAGFKVNAEIVGAVGGTTAPLVLSRTSVAALFPLTSSAMSSLPSPFRSAAMIQPPPVLDNGGGTR